MAYHLIVVEGAHDAAFIGILLRERGLHQVRLRAEVDVFWTRLIPTQFPANLKGRLDRVVKFPDFYSDSTIPPKSVAVAVAGGFDLLKQELQADLDTLDLTQLTGVAVIADADEVSPDQRLADLLRQLSEVNRDGSINQVDGFPLTLPNSAGVQNGPGPRVGVYVCCQMGLEPARSKRYC